MARVVFGDKERYGQWVADRVPGMVLQDDNYEAHGVIDSEGNQVAGVVFNHFSGHDIAMHVAAERGKVWATPKVLSFLFGYPFNQLRCRRVTGYVSQANASTLAFDLKLGFRIEGLLRDATPEGDMIVIGMTRNECRWVTNHG
jgi:hypothetical protein